MQISANLEREQQDSLRIQNDSVSKINGQKGKKRREGEYVAQLTEMEVFCCLCSTCVEKHWSIAEYYKLKGVNIILDLENTGIL